MQLIHDSHHYSGWQTTDGRVTETLWMQVEFPKTLDPADISAAGISLLCHYLISVLPYDELVEVYDDLADRCSVYGIPYPALATSPIIEREQLSQRREPRVLKPLTRSLTPG
ncbi:MAG: hypothetical protein AB7L91_06865 [Dehalococcoidia bacterium]